MIKQREVDSSKLIFWMSGKPQSGGLFKHGIYYGTRELCDHRSVHIGYGIAVMTWRNGKWIESDNSTTPWPTKAVALDRARCVAESKRENGENDLPIIQESIGEAA